MGTMGSARLDGWPERASIWWHARLALEQPEMRLAWHRIVCVSGGFVVPLEERLRPQAVELDLKGAGEAISAAEDELRGGAIEDRDRCCGYFPALAGMSGIRTELPACRVLAEALPAISHAGMTFGFNFLRLSLVCQSADPVFHLDSDAATALTGDPNTLNEREVRRLLLNLSSQHDRVLHYLDVDPFSSGLVVEASYVRAHDPERLRTRARVAVIPPRIGTTVHALAFASNRVLHSGVDGRHGHFIAAYGVEKAVPARPARRPPNTARKRSRRTR